MILETYLFLIPLCVWASIQLLKILIDYSIDRTIKIQNLWWAWGFPSVHSWISSSITTLVFLSTGASSIEFAITFIFSFLFWYDAMNVRYEAWKHAHYINNIRSELKSVLNTHDTFRHLKERLWHTPTEVVGGIIIWCLMTLSFHLLLMK